MKLQQLPATHKTTIILIGAIFVLGILGYFGYQKFTSQKNTLAEEVDLVFDAEGPFAILSPRRDGNALVLNLKRTASYDVISYELAYASKVEETKVLGNKILDEGESGNSGVIDRGVQGTIDTKDKKGEYEQEILFGTCSKNVCKYDKGVENGTLTLHIKKRDKAYKMITQWHLQKPDLALGLLISGDTHFNYKLDIDRQALSNIGFTIINDLTGVPKLPSGKSVLGKVYSLNTPIAKDLNAGEVTVELVENPSPDVKLYRYDLSKGNWEELETKIKGSKLTGKAKGAGIFAVLSSKK